MSLYRKLYLGPAFPIPWDSWTLSLVWSWWSVHSALLLSHLCGGAVSKGRVRRPAPQGTPTATQFPGTHFCLSLLFFFSFFLPHCAACGVSVPRPGIEPCPLMWKCRVLTTRLPGKSCLSLLFLAKEYMLGVQILNNMQVRQVKTPPLLMITTVIDLPRVFWMFFSVLLWFLTLEHG